MTLELFKELATLLAVNFVRDDDCCGDSVPVVEHDSEVVLERSFTEGKSLDAVRIRKDLGFEDGLCSLVNPLEDARVSGAQNARVVNWHFLIIKAANIILNNKFIRCIKSHQLKKEN